jgi:hypothetical protein
MRYEVETFKSRPLTQRSQCTERFRNFACKYIVEGIKLFQLHEIPNARGNTTRQLVRVYEQGLHHRQVAQRIRKGTVKFVVREIQTAEQGPRCSSNYGRNWTGESV